MRYVKFVLVLALMCGGGLQAREYAPRVISPHNADAYSMKTFAQYARWKDLKGDARLWEVYKYLADKRTGLYPMGAGAWEGKDMMYDFGYIRDPVKMINVYNVGYCDMLGPTMAGVLLDMGMGKTRTVNLPLWHHVLAEVYYDDKWHYADLDVRAAFRREDGSLASMDDAKKDDSLWKGPTNPYFFPLDKLSSARAVYAKSPIEYRHGVNMGGHTMDFVLRRGETLTRWWTPQGDRWNHHESYHQGGIKAILEREPKGPKCKHAGTAYTIHTRGNGQLVYKPDLTSKSQDFADGVYSSQNVKPGAAGLTLEKAGEGFAIIEIHSPYVIVPSVGQYETTDDDKEASVVKIDGQDYTLSISQDNGMSWKDVAVSGGVVDLTQHVARTYGYLLKIALKGEPEKAVVKGLEITSWVQVHPAALPSLRQGKNQMNYVTNDHYGLQSRVMEIRTNGSIAEDFLKWCSEPPKDFKAERKTSRAIGQFVVKVQPPPGAKVAWFSGGGNFCTHQQGGSPNTKNAIAWAADEPKDFKQFYKAEVPAGNSHWHYNADVEVKLDAPAKVLYLQYTGDPGVNNLRIFAHCVEDAPVASTGVVIEHGWSENKVAKTKKVTLDKPGPYEIECEAEPVDDFIRLSVPSSLK